MQRQLRQLASTGLIALGILVSSQSTGLSQWWGGYYSTYYSPYYSSYYWPSYGWGYGYASYYAPSYDYAWSGAGYYPSTSNGCCDSCCGLCSGCGIGGCAGGGCGVGCAPDATGDPMKPEPDSKASGKGPYKEGDDGTESEGWKRRQNSGDPDAAKAGTGDSAKSPDDLFNERDEQQRKKVPLPEETVPQRKDGDSADQQKQAPAGGDKAADPEAKDNQPQPDADAPKTGGSPRSERSEPDGSPH